jgi:hypothetical protein
VVDPKDQGSSKGPDPGSRRFDLLLENMPTDSDIGHG